MTDAGDDGRTLAGQVEAFLVWMAAGGYSDWTVRSRRAHLRHFVSWCDERGVDRAGQVDRPLLERYQAALWRHRKTDGRPLALRSQHLRLTGVRALFVRLARQGAIAFSPAAELRLPKLERSLPKHVLTVSEAERVLAVPDVDTDLGLRDRAILETLYCTGVRRMELAGIRLYDLDPERGVIRIRKGKGRKDRVVPVGLRAMAWIERYLVDVRPLLACRGVDDQALFVTIDGRPVTDDRLTQLVRAHVDAADLGKTGSCHLFRHTAATLMLENGADIRFIQAMLGHAKVETTQIYTHVSIRQLKAVHDATHPACNPGRGRLEDRDDEEGR